MRGKAWLWCLAVYLIIRWVLLVHPGYIYDTAAYKRWAVNAAANGISQVYRTSDMDYPPLYAYILAPLAKLYLWITPDASHGVEDTPLLTALVKLPPLIFDLAIALLLFLLARAIAAARGSPRPGQAHPGRGGMLRSLGALWPVHGKSDVTSGTHLRHSQWVWILPAAYLLHPAVIFIHGYWGQVDSVHSLFILAAFLFLAAGPKGRAWPAWILLALATSMKPLGAPFFPMLLLLTLLGHGMVATLLGAAAATGTGLLVLLPFLLAGQGGEVLHRILGDVHLMAYTSTNAHNFWWIYGPWQDAGSPRYGPFCLTHISLAAFGLVYLALLWRAWILHRTQADGITPAQHLALACGVGASFFMISTRMHENHLFIAIPLLLPLITAGRWWRWLFAAAGLGVFLNVLLHDLTIPGYPPFTLGGTTGVTNAHLQTIDVDRTFHLGELVGIWLGVAVNVIFYGALMYSILSQGSRSPLEALYRGGQHTSR